MQLKYKIEYDVIKQVEITLSDEEYQQLPHNASLNQPTQLSVPVAHTQEFTLTAHDLTKSNNQLTGLIMELKHEQPTSELTQKVIDAKKEIDQKQIALTQLRSKHEKHQAHVRLLVSTMLAMVGTTLFFMYPLVLDKSPNHVSWSFMWHAFVLIYVIAYGTTMLCLGCDRWKQYQLAKHTTVELKSL